MWYIFILFFIFFKVLSLYAANTYLGEGSEETAGVGNVHQDVEGLMVSFQTTLRLNDPCEEPRSQWAYLGSIVPPARRVSDGSSPLNVSKRSWIRAWQTSFVSMTACSKGLRWLCQPWSRLGDYRLYWTMLRGCLISIDKSWRPGK